MSATSFLELLIPAERYEIRLSGSGGQGMMLAAMLLSEAIGADPNLNVVQTKSYGPEARGGASKADIVVSPREIFYPKPFRLDLLLAMTQEAVDKYYPDLRDEGVLIIDNTLVLNPPETLHYGLPFTQLARDEVQNVMVANVISLGAIATITGLVSSDTMLQAVLTRAPKGTEEKNKLALEIGFREGEKLRREERYRAVPALPAWAQHQNTLCNA
jgi:2-oxoglutarate ferredoxin oxidoreductase subunit gamma